MWCTAAAVGLVLLLLVSPSAAPLKAQVPQRIVSLNICTDELLVALADRTDIAALSFLARDPRSSSIVDIAQTLPQASGRAEQALTFNPDLVLAGSFTTRSSVDLLRRVGIQVEVFPIANTIEGLFANIARLGRLLGRTDRAESLIASLRSRLAAVRASLAGKDKSGSNPTAIFYQIGSVASGSGTLADNLLRLADLTNLAAERGLRGFAPFPLEQVIFADPDMIIISSRVFRYQTPVAANMRHPALQNAMRKNGLVTLPENLMTCAKPATVYVVERLIAARKKRVRR